MLRWARCLPQQREQQHESRSTAAQKKCNAVPDSCSSCWHCSCQKAVRPDASWWHYTNRAPRCVWLLCQARSLTHIPPRAQPWRFEVFLGGWELRVSHWQRAANKRCPRESIEIATLCRVAPVELRTMPQQLSHAKSRSLRNATKNALSANRGWSAHTSQGSADMAADAALKGKDNGIKKS